MVLNELSALASLDANLDRINLGMAIDTMTAMTAITIINSISVKPWRFFMQSLSFIPDVIKIHPANNDVQ